MRKMKALALSGLVALSLCMGTLPVSAARSYQDKESITNTGVDLSTTQTLTVAKPSSAVSTTAAKYYITGTSDPGKNLTVNGQAVEYRGQLGSWGVLVELVLGRNVFTIRNGEASQTVVITREKTADTVVKTTKLTVAKPTYNDMTFAGEYTLRCTAPSGARVTATVAGQTVELEQVAATAESGVPAVFRGTIQLEAGEIESITYTLNYQGAVSTVKSVGSLTVLEEGSQPTVAVNQHASTVYESDDMSSNFVAMLNAGAQDKVLTFSGDLAQLSMGGWIKKEFLDLVEGDPSVENHIRSQSWSRGEGGEYLTLQGSVPSAFKGYMNSEKVVLRFYHMKGVGNLSVKDSSLFEKARISSSEDSVTLSFYLKEGKSLLGYDVRYEEDGSIRIFFNAPPELGTEERPLSNTTVVVDAGHGGFDPGALGVLNGEGPVENDITMAHAIALQKRLESLGATVVMSVTTDLPEDEKIVLHDRVDMTRQAEADFFISLHCNSVGGSANDLKAKGTEVYYYENISRELSQSVLSALTEGTGRELRGCYYSNYFVTRNSLCPGMLVEMGFISSPEEYDSLRSEDSLFATANAVADSIIDFLA